MYFGKPVQSYEELLLLAGQGALLDAEVVQPRPYCGLWRLPLEGYGEFHCPSLGNAQIDDKVRWQFFGRDVASYEELLALGGEDALLDDGCPKSRKAVSQPFLYYGKRLDSYEELLSVAGSGAALDALDAW